MTSRAKTRFRHTWFVASPVWSISATVRQAVPPGEIDVAPFVRL